jgi:uncharacterized membrane protein YidH (DUF202 family)
MADDDARSLGEAWDEGLAPERTELAWGRTGLAVLVALGVLARRVWSLSGWLEITALTVFGVGGLVWLVGMRLSRDLHLTMEPHGLDGRTAFGLVTLGTFLLALGGLVFGIVR